MRHTNVTRFFTGTLAATLALNPLGGVIQQVSANELDVMSADDIVKANLKKSIKESFSLIDLGYIKELSSSSYGSILKNKTEDGSNIKLTYSSTDLEFSKGLCVGANSEIVYDISKQSDKYDTLSFFAGLDKGEPSTGGIRFLVYSSDDKEEWKPLYQSGFINSEDSALLLNLDIKDAKYIKLVTFSENENVETKALYGDIQLLVTESLKAESKEVENKTEEEESIVNEEIVTESLNEDIVSEASEKDNIDDKSEDVTTITEDTTTNIDSSIATDSKDNGVSTLTVSSTSIATFSFDGTNAGKIMIDSGIVSSGAKIRYSLNKGANWTETTDHAIKLTDDQINSITVENDIWVGLADSDEYSVIDILSGDKIDAGKLYKNDAENRFFGKTEYLQVSTDKGVTWKDYEPTMRFNGSIVVKVRYKAHGVYMMGAENQYTFAADTTSDTRKLIPIENIKSHSACSQENETTFSSGNMISGDGNTSWMSTAKTGNEELHYTVEFDSVKYVSEVEYLPYSMQKGRLKSGEIYASYDGVHWELIHQFSGLSNDRNSKSIKFGTKVFTRYIKIVATETYEDPKVSNSQNTYFSGNLFTFYEDSTVQYSDKPEIHYSTKDSTTSAVTATLHLPDGYFTDVRTHRFTRNDTFNFTYRDANNQTYTIEAEVNWINLLSGERGVYLSDMDYVPNLLDAWDGVKIDKNPSSSDISLLVNGEKVGFSKGLGIHAPSTIVYDIEAYRDEYPILSVFMGVDASRNKNGSVKFVVSGSNDGLTWTPIHTTKVLKGNTDCEYLKVNISNYSYIKLYADSTSDGAGSDHSVYADARLIRTDYDINTEKLTTILKVEEYDSLIKAAHTPGTEMTQEVKSLVMKRAFVDRYGYANIQQMGQTDPTYKEAVEYIFTNEDVLSLFLEAGSLEYGTGLNGIRSWCRLYAAHKDDLNNEMHKKIMIATAVAMSRNIQSYMSSWGGGYRYADAVLRYNLMKNLYDNNRFLNYTQFDSLSMELIRSVVDSRLGDDEVLWLRNYTEHREPTNITKRLNPYTFVSYIHPNYGGADLRDPAKYAEWDAKYLLSQNNVLDYGKENMPKIWMAVERGGICWGISGFGSATNEVHGIPSINIYQPGHEAYVTYSEDDQGRGKWAIGNSITGWAKSYSKWAGFDSTFARMLLGWGNRSYSKDTKNNASYILLAQGALNEYSKYKESMFYNFLAKTYADDATEQIKVYNKALEKQSINLDAFEGLINAYKNDSTKTSTDWFELAKKVIKEYTYYPLPMVELLGLISEHITNEIQSAEIDIAKTNALIKATNATSDVSLQYDACKAVATSLLGTETTYLATFSFDGDDAGKIVLNEKYRQYTVRVRYSLDGGHSYKQTDNQVIQLTEDEIAQINADDDLIVGLIGTEETYTIDIKNSSDLASNIYANDEENTLIGGNLANLEYSFDGNHWENYDGLGLKSENRFEDEVNPSVTVKFRYRATGTYLAGNIKEFTFKFNPFETENIRYLQLQHVSLHGFSTEQTNPDNKAKNILDGNPGTIWHTKWSYLDPDKYISVKFDKVRYISKITLAPSGVNGRLKSGNIYTSIDGEEWTLVKSFGDFPSDDSLRIIDLGDSYEAKYVKLVATSTYGQAGQANYFLSGKSMSFYEDISKTYKANATISYSNTDPTSGSVTATLILPKGCEAVGESEFTFTSNGSHKFVYTDANGEEQYIMAEVNNIDESLPTMNYTFDYDGPTNKDVTMTITGFSKENVKIINVEEENIIGASSSLATKESLKVNTNYPTTYTFTDNKTLIFTLEDSAGRVNKISVTVDWIDRIPPTAKVEYSTTSSTREPVTVTLKDFSEEDVTVVNNGGKPEYTFTQNGSFIFEISDKAGNITKIPVNVTWISLEGPIVNIKYSSEELTNQSVTAYVEGLKEGEVVVNNSGKTSYTFEENGSFEFIVRDSLGRESRALAIVDWIDKTPPTATVKYSTTSPTNDPVKVTLTDFSEEDVVVVNNGGKPEYTFEENGIFKFILRDKAGNESEIPVSVNWITKDNSNIGVNYNIKNITNQNVTVSLTGLTDTDSVINNGGKTSYTFEENGTFIFEVKNSQGIITKIPVVVDWIDKTKPTASIVFSNDYWTNEDVVVKLVNISEEITVLNTQNNSLTHTFKENGQFEFKFVDKAGNIGTVKAVVNWIDKSKPKEELTITKLDTTGNAISVRLNIDLNKIEILNNGGKADIIFTKNGLFKFKLKMKDTGYEFEYPILVNWIDELNVGNPSVDDYEDTNSNNNSNGNNTGNNSVNGNSTGNGNNNNINHSDKNDAESHIDKMEDESTLDNIVVDDSSSSVSKDNKKFNWILPISSLSLSLILTIGAISIRKKILKDKSNKKPFDKDDK